MKQRLLAAIVYLSTAVAQAVFFDGLYGAGPVTHHLTLVHSAIAGAILFAIACPLSLFMSRFGILCGLTASILSWPFFGILLFATPWSSLVSLLVHSADWRDHYTAIVMLIISSACSVSGLRSLFPGPVANAGT
jgi:hypothetical protein